MDQVTFKTSIFLISFLSKSRIETSYRYKQKIQSKQQSGPENESELYILLFKIELFILKNLNKCKNFCSM